MAKDPEWQDSAATFSDKLRSWLQNRVHSDSFKQWQEGMNENLTYMDWTWNWTGVDMTYVWDPELWVKLQEAVKWGEPNIFWNKLWDRIEYSE
jgi:cell division protease FtsH